MKTWDWGCGSMAESSFPPPDFVVLGVGWSHSHTLGCTYLMRVTHQILIVTHWSQFLKFFSIVISAQGLYCNAGKRLAVKWPEIACPARDHREQGLLG